MFMIDLQSKVSKGLGLARSCPQPHPQKTKKDDVRLGFESEHTPSGGTRNEEQAKWSAAGRPCNRAVAQMTRFRSWRGVFVKVSLGNRRLMTPFLCRNGARVMKNHTQRVRLCRISLGTNASD